MRKTRQWFKLTAVEQAVYYELITVCNEKKWPETFPCSNKRLYRTLNISLPTLLKAREKLINAGLIYYSSGRSAGIENIYSFIDNLSQERVAGKSTKRFKSRKNLSETAPDIVCLPPKDILEDTIKENLEDTNKDTLGDTPKKSLDYINIYTNKTPSIPHESVRVFPVNFIEFSKIKELLLADQTWKEQTAMQSDADMVMFINRPGCYGKVLTDMEGNEITNAGELIIAKYRSGPIGKVKFKHNKTITKIFDFS